MAGGVCTGPSQSGRPGGPVVEVRGADMHLTARCVVRETGEGPHVLPVSSWRFGRGSERTPRHCSSTGSGITNSPSASWGKSLMKLFSLWRGAETLPD